MRQTLACRPGLEVGGWLPVPERFQVEANLLRLNETWRLPYLPELVARKTAGPERVELGDADLALHEHEYARLLAELERRCGALCQVLDGVDDGLVVYPETSMVDQPGEGNSPLIRSVSYNRLSRDMVAMSACTRGLRWGRPPRPGLPTPEQTCPTDEVGRVAGCESGGSTRPAHDAGADSRGRGPSAGALGQDGDEQQPDEFKGDG